MSDDEYTKTGAPALDENAVPLKLTPSQVARLVAQQAESWCQIDALPDTEERRTKREAFKRDAARAWAEYQRTGLHLTGAEIDRWTASWGTDHELPPPKPHM